MRRDSRRLQRSLDPSTPLRNRRGQILLEALVMAVFLTGFFGLMIAFTDETHGRLKKTQWTHRERSR